MGHPDPHLWDMATQSLFAGLQLLPHESGPPVECELYHDEAEDSHEVNHDRPDRSPAPLSSSSDKSAEINSSQDSSGATTVAPTDVGLPGRTQPRKFYCQSCENKPGFTRESDLRRHMFFTKKHGGENRFVCFCESAFSRKDNFMNHLKSHGGHSLAS